MQQSNLTKLGPQSRELNIILGSRYKLFKYKTLADQENLNIFGTIDISN